MNKVYLVDVRANEDIMDAIPTSCETCGAYNCDGKYWQFIDLFKNDVDMFEHLDNVVDSSMMQASANNIELIHAKKQSEDNDIVIDEFFDSMTGEMMLIIRVSIMNIK